jgi:hypothetical protein
MLTRAQLSNTDAKNQCVIIVAYAALRRCPIDATSRQTTHMQPLAVAKQTKPSSPRNKHKSINFHASSINLCLDHTSRHKHDTT